MKNKPIYKHPWQSITDFVLAVKSLLMELDSKYKVIRSVVVYYHDNNDNTELVNVVFNSSRLEIGGKNEDK